MAKKQQLRTSERHNLAVSATAEVIAEIDRLVEASPVDTSRSGIALAAIREGLPILARKLEPKSKS